MSETPAEPPAPPTLRNWSPPPQRSTWPVVIGVITIVFAGLSILANGCGMFAPLTFSWMADVFPDEEAEQFRQMGKHAVRLAAVAGVLTVLGIVQLVAGIGLLQRTRWAVKVFIVWAVLKMIAVLIEVGMSIAMQWENAEAIREQDPADAQATFIMGTYWAVATLLWGWALPVFGLIWFARPKIRGETARWGAPGGHDAPPPSPAMP